MPARRIETYKQAFIVVLGMPIDEKIKSLIKRLENEGHTEKGISFAIWRSQEKLNVFKYDHRFMSILENEINKWSWKNGDPRWAECWKRKDEAKKAEKIRREIDKHHRDEQALKRIEKRAKRPVKNPDGYLYFIQGEYGGAIKIGFSVDPQRRLVALQTGYPDTLKILLIIPGDTRMEAALHRKFEGSRLKGEWFRPDDHVLEKIKELKVKYAAVNSLKN